MEESFDLLVVGSGVAGSTAAKLCRKAGWSVAVIDERPFGGTCALRGCDPKKLLRRAAEVVEAVRLFHGKGVEDPGVRVSWPDLMRFKRDFTDPIPQSREKSFRDAGIACFHGTARFRGNRSLEVEERRLQAKHILIASGAEPQALPIAGAEAMVTSDDFLSLEDLPPRVLLVGGGYISFELAHIAARCGAEVTVLDMDERPLTYFDPELVERLVARSRRAGIDFRPNAKVHKIERRNEGLEILAEVAGERQSFEADLAVHGAGRVSSVARLDLEAGNVKGGPEGIEVDEHLQSVSNPVVYAAGDAAATKGPPLTPVANLEGELAAKNLLEKNAHTADYHAIPSVVFTLPELARVGRNEAEAEEEGLRYETAFFDMEGWYSLRRIGESCGAAKVLTERGSGRLLGAHLLAPDAGELINLFAFAMRNGLPASAFQDFLSAYPTAASDIPHLLR